MRSIKTEYFNLLSNKILVRVEDLTENEKVLIQESFILFEEKLEDIKLLKDEIKRLNITLCNMKSMQDDSDYE
jgi:hypothetical protein